MFTFLVKTFGRRYPIPTTTLQLCSLLRSPPTSKLKAGLYLSSCAPERDPKNGYEKLPKKKYISYVKKTLQFDWLDQSVLSLAQHQLVPPFLILHSNYQNLNISGIHSLRGRPSRPNLIKHQDDSSISATRKKKSKWLVYVTTPNFPLI